LCTLGATAPEPMPRPLLRVSGLGAFPPKRFSFVKTLPMQTHFFDTPLGHDGESSLMLLRIEYDVK
jgi:hypothetical protein